MTQPDWTALRSQFPALSREVNDAPVAYFDGPAGSQVPRCVAEAVSDYLLQTNANRGAPFATAQESDAILEDAHRTLAAFLGTPDPATIVFGQNMTTLALHLSRSLAQTWQPGDEILVSQLDHDANVTPWGLAARDAGVTVQQISLRPADGTLDMEDFHAKLSPRTRFLAVGYASNALGTINPVREMIAAAREFGAVTFIDAVHYAPHGRINVTDLDCDFLAVSAYKFFGPHVGVLYGKQSAFADLTPYKLRPSTNEMPGRWMTGTQNHEGIAGAAAAVRYLAEHVGGNADLLIGLDSAFRAIQQRENELCEQLLTGLAKLPRVRIWGIADPSRLAERVPTVSITHETKTPLELATALGQQGLFAWAGNHYALPVTTALDLEPHGTLRVGLLHYNTPGEVDRLLSALTELV